MTTKFDPGKIAHMLTLSTRRLDESTLSALSNARQLALERQAKAAPTFVLATGHELFSAQSHSAQRWLIAGLLAATLIVGLNLWNHVQEQQTAELDVAILTDDLPIEIFVD